MNLTPERIADELKGTIYDTPDDFCTARYEGEEAVVRDARLNAALAQFKGEKVDG